ncbi:GNAT family N-acetyltransferase [Microbacterium sp. Sa4CUA7]|uniref:GNAT family N-acetyltransferase n=1 Tax=Microbacterium pullorum TaxID=2762236 RepID=A0ABR8S4G3_9MICO|nr:GNAT family N-acetyltransferase [Microbacterium pullorum]MBD7958375.1 GNAT family N-acetyltransferase [Microbacterium pullorum]
MPSAPPLPLRAECLADASAYRGATALYARVFGYADPDFSLNPNLLSALARNGGSAVGVFTPEDELIGFAYGFAGRDADGREFHYSQAAVVDPRHQGRGVGRMLKDCQRRVALGWGHDTMRWTFDPLLARNAHFNFSVLGAEGVAYVPDYYDRPGTDRIVVDWALRRTADPYAALRAAAPPALGRADWGRVVTSTLAAVDGATHPAAWLAVPTDVTGVAGRQDEADAAGDALRVRVRAGLTTLLDGERVLVACRRIDAETAAYLAVPRRATTPPMEGATSS